jgi:hypothetical protein
MTMLRHRWRTVCCSSSHRAREGVAEARSAQHRHLSPDPHDLVAHAISGIVQAQAGGHRCLALGEHPGRLVVMSRR